MRTSSPFWAPSRSIGWLNDCSPYVSWSTPSPWSRTSTVQLTFSRSVSPWSVYSFGGPSYGSSITYVTDTSLPTAVSLGTLPSVETVKAPAVPATASSPTTQSSVAVALEQGIEFILIV